MLQQDAGGHGDVIEDAKAAAVIGKGVVGAPRQVAGHAVLQGELRRAQGAAHRQPGALHQRLGGRQTNAPLGLAI